MIYQTTVTVEFVERQCPVCGVRYCLEQYFYEHRKNNKASFYCPNGHGLQHSGKTDAQRAREAEQVAALAKARALELEKKLERAKKRTRQRAETGLCQYCRRHFANVERHVQNKHKEPAS